MALSEFRQIPGVGNGTYTRDVSQWVIGYVLGTDWDPKTVAYANDVYADDEHYAAYEGVYLKTSEEATPFEAMLASIGDSVLTYESKRYKEQRAFAFANSSETDPFTHTEAIRSDLSKIASLDVEHILSTDQVLSGQFASYHVYPYYPDYLHFYEDHEWESLGIGDKALYATEEGTTNTYRAYLQMLTNHHGMPVVIAELVLLLRLLWRVVPVSMVGMNILIIPSGWMHLKNVESILIFTLCVVMARKSFCLGI